MQLFNFLSSPIKASDSPDRCYSFFSVFIHLFDYFSFLPLQFILDVIFAYICFYAVIFLKLNNMFVILNEIVYLPIKQLPSGDNVSTPNEVATQGRQCFK